MGILGAVSELAGKCRVWSHAKVEKKALEAGHQFVQMAKANDGRLTIDQLNSVYRGILPKGVKLQAVSDPKAGEAFLRSLNLLSEDTISMFMQGAQAFVAKSLKGETLFYIPIEKFAGDKAVNIATHEFEHAVNGKMTLQGKIQSILCKMLGPKRVERMAAKDFEMINRKSMSLQHGLIGMKLMNPLYGTTHHSADTKGLLEYLASKSPKEMSEGLTRMVRRVLDPQAERRNIKILKRLRRSFADERRAYRVGGQAAREYIDLQRGCTTSEIVSELYGATADVMKQEMRAQRIKRLKRLFGLKVEDYEGITKPAIVRVRALSDKKDTDAIAGLTNTMNTPQKKLTFQGGKLHKASLSDKGVEAMEVIMKRGVEGNTPPAGIKAKELAEELEKTQVQNNWSVV